MAANLNGGGDGRQAGWVWHRSGGRHPEGDAGYPIPAWNRLTYIRREHHGRWTGGAGRDLWTWTLFLWHLGMPADITAMLTL